MLCDCRYSAQVVSVGGGDVHLLAVGDERCPWMFPIHGLKAGSQHRVGKDALLCLSGQKVGSGTPAMRNSPGQSNGARRS